MRRAGYGPKWKGRLRAACWPLLTVLCLSVGMGSAEAQSAVDGGIAGTVRDATAAVVPHAAVIVRNGGTGATFAGETDGRGFYQVVHLVPGTYSVTVAQGGFAAYSAPSVVVEVGRLTELNASLVAGGLTTTVTVNGSAAGSSNGGVSTGAELNTENTAFTANITQDEIHGLPSNGRRWSDFALLTPGANPDSSGTGLVSFRGMSPLLNNSTTDGGDDNQAFFGEARGRSKRAAYSFSQSAVREFQVNTANYSSQYGRAAGAVVNTVSRSGSNDLHGGLFFYYRNSALGATNPFSIVHRYSKATGRVTREYVKPPDIRQQWGGTLGGALIRQKLFFFYAYDQQHRDYPAVSTTQSTTFLELTVNQMALLANRGVRPPQVGTAIAYLTGLTGQVPRTGDQIINFPKLDWQMNERNHIAVQYNRMRWNSPAGVQTAPVVGYGTTSLGNDFVKVDSVLARWSTYLTENVSNELRYQHGRDFEYETSQTPSPQLPTTGPGGLPPEVDITGGLIFGTPTGLLRRRYPDERREQGTETLSWVRGGHLFTLGADYNYVHDKIDSLYNASGTYHYSNIVDWITDFTFSTYPTGGCPSIFSQPHYECYRDYTQGFGRSAFSFATRDYAGFVQDDWKALPSLTVNFGVRYEFEQLPKPQLPNPAIDGIFGSVGSTSAYPADANNVGPRLGIAWSPFARGIRTGSTVIRAGYGVYYGRVINATINSALSGSGSAGSALRATLTPKNSQAPIYPQTLAPVMTTGPATTSVVFDRHFQAPMIQQAEFSVEQEVGRKVTLTASYLMSESRELPNFIDINIAPSTGTKMFSIQGGPPRHGTLTGETFVVPLYTVRRNTNYGTITDIKSNISGSYNALVLEARRRLSHGVEMRANWTWSKALDFGQNETVGYDTSDQFDPFNIRYDRSLSNFNFPHKIVVAAIFEPVTHRGDALVRGVVNGWRLSPVFVDVSGYPYSYNITGGTSLPGGFKSINGSGGAIYLPTVGRNTQRLPDTQNLDLRLSRSFSVHERWRLEANAEGFNVLNRQNYSGLNTIAYTVGSTSQGVTQLLYQDANKTGTPFGQFTSAGTNLYRERQVQFALRLEF